MSITRCGIGYDIHRLGQNRQLILGGVRLPYLLGLEGHSDADVLSHAIADALLGAVCAGDIGQHFPDTDESIRGISSIEILKRVTQILADKKTRVVNIDATVIAEAPKIAPHIPAMRKEIAKAIGVSDAEVSIKATTNERLGPIGRGEGIAANAPGWPQFFQIQMRQFSVTGKFVDPKINGFVVGLVGEIAFDQFGDHFDHAREITRLGRAGIFVGAFDAQSLEIFKKSAFERFGEIVERNLRFPCAADGFVVDIGNVHHPMDLEAARFEMPLQQILENIRPKISNVRLAINGRPAGVHRNVWWIERGEILQLPRVGVEQPDHVRTTVIPSENASPARTEGSRGSFL